MKYQETFLGAKPDFADYIKKTVPDLFGKRLTVEGKSVELPGDCDLEWKVKYDVSEEGGSLSIKVSWDYGKDDSEDEEVEVDVD